MPSRSRSYAFTINNWTDEDLETVRRLSSTALYVVACRETGDQGTPHLQCYVYFEHARSFDGVKRLLPRAHIEVARSSPQRNDEYCRKGGDIAFVHGEVPVQGQRGDLASVKELLSGGATMSDIVDSAGVNYQCVRMAEVWLKYHERKRDWKPEVRWYWGPTGVGKTKTAVEWLGDGYYTALDDGKFFEGYDGHENVLIDDFRKDFCKFHVLLKMLDRYPYRVEVKGSSRQFLAKKIAITSPYPPDVVYNTREDVGQLLRRIDEVIHVE